MPCQVLAAKLKADANISFQNGDYEAAAHKYADAIVNDPSNAILYSNRSATYYHLEMYGAALDDAERAIHFQPSWGKAWGRKAAALLAQHRYAEAIKAYEEGLRCGDSSKVLQDGLQLALSQKASPAPPAQCSLPLPLGLAGSDNLHARVVTMYRKKGGHLPPGSAAKNLYDAYALWDQGLCLGLLGDMSGSLTSLFNAVYFDLRAPVLIQPMKSLNCKFMMHNVIEIVSRFMTHRWTVPSSNSEKAKSHASLSIHVMSNFFILFITSLLNNRAINGRDASNEEPVWKAIVEDMEGLIHYVENARAQASPSYRAAADSCTPSSSSSSSSCDSGSNTVLLLRLSLAEDDGFPLWAISKQLLSFLYTQNAKWLSYCKPKYSEKKMIQLFEKAHDLDPRNIGTLYHLSMAYSNSAQFNKVIAVKEKLHNIAPEDEEAKSSSSYEACYARLHLTTVRPLAMWEFRTMYLEARSHEKKSRPIFGSVGRATKQYCREIYKSKEISDDFLLGVHVGLDFKAQKETESDEAFHARVYSPGRPTPFPDRYIIKRNLSRECNKCGKDSLKMQICSGCKGVSYCSRACQTEDWKVHKKTCTPRQKK
eukprot:TRINITY_DN8251_c0_g1_i1.p1 TRINITY_DN8251_c0_g1~~TRINITY_DN8251_c0_g1_i1.p1  ORF type:complete len:672 (+),score=54.33 TRINITY_DN8251_c0_g1_i1:232-2016(+)